MSAINFQRRGRAGVRRRRRRVRINCDEMKEACDEFLRSRGLPVGGMVPPMPPGRTKKKD